MLLALALLSLSAVAAGAQCPPPGDMFYLLPHEDDCSKFYICSHGTPVLQTCPEGTHFNPNFMVCQSPIFAGCASELPPSELPCSWPDHVLWHPHPDSCSQYYVCVHGEAQVFDCPAGLEFSNELKECVWPHESNCKSQNAPNDQEEQNGGQEQDGGQQNGGCVEGALSSNKDCARYNVCSHGALVAMDCPHGLHWNSKLQFCDWPQSAGNIFKKTAVLLPPFLNCVIVGQH